MRTSPVPELLQYVRHHKLVLFDTADLRLTHRLRKIEERSDTIRIDYQGLANPCFWQVGLAHFGRLIWPTLGR
jgi:hypothetical protein